jgi:hypothetical protein
LLATGVEDLAEYAHAASGKWIDADRVMLLSPLSSPTKILCIRLNYADHAAESAGYDEGWGTGRHVLAHVHEAFLSLACSLICRSWLKPLPD